MNITKTIIITILLLILGCTYLEDAQFPFTGREDISEPSLFQTGIEGLDIRFVGTQTRVREGSVFDLIFELQNKGYSDISEGVFKLITEKPYITVEKDRGAIILKGKNQYMPQGEAKRIKFRAKAGTIEQDLHEYPTKATMIVCYSYETVATEMVCIDPDIEGLQKSKPCFVEDLILPEGQGSPVAVTEIKPRIEFTEQGATPAFEIYIRNEGLGQVISPDYIEHACGPKAKTQTPGYDTIQVEAILSNKELTCTPKEIDIKKDEEVRIYCEQTTPLIKRQTYNAPLQIKIKYGYLTSAGGDIIITKKG